MNTIPGDAPRGRKFDQVRQGAATVFLRDGYAGASVDDIARAARVSKATLYTYFADKSLMFREVMSFYADDLFRDRADIRPVDGAPGESLTGLLVDLLSFVLAPDSLRLHRLAIAEALRFPCCIADYQRRRDACTVGILRAQIDRWIERGEIAAHDSDRSARQLLAMLCGDLLTRALLGQIPADTQIRQAACDCARFFNAAHSWQRRDMAS